MSLPCRLSRRLWWVLPVECLMSVASRMSMKSNACGSHPFPGELWIVIKLSAPRAGQVSDSRDAVTSRGCPFYSHHQQNNKKRERTQEYATAELGLIWNSVVHPFCLPTLASYFWCERPDRVLVDKISLLQYLLWRLISDVNRPDRYLWAYFVIPMLLPWY